MANWKIKIDIADIWQKYEDDEDFDAFKEELVPILQSYQEEVSDKLDEDEAMDYEDLVSEIANDTEDVEDFDNIWQRMYDWADYNKVWLGTF